MNQKIISRIRLPLCFVILAGLVGCQSIRDHKNEKLMSIRDNLRARKAWKEVRKNCDNIDAPKDFGRGFRQGYSDVAKGGNGCAPALPPRRYWSIKYQSHEGRYKQRRWFDGYEHGVLAAQKSNVVENNYLETSNRIMHDKPIPEYQQLTDATGPSIKEMPLPAPAPAVSPVEEDSNITPPLLPISSPGYKSLSHTFNKETSIPSQTKDDLSDFQPFDDDTPDLYASEDLNINLPDNELYEESKASEIEIRPASNIQQVDYVNEQQLKKPVTKQIIIQPKVKQAHNIIIKDNKTSNSEASEDKTGEEDNWLMPEQK